METFLAVFFAILAAALVIWIVGVAIPASIRENREKEATRSRAQIEIQVLRSTHCTPDDAEDLDRAATEEFQSGIDRSALDPMEKEALEVAFENAMEQARCGPSARE